jgi:signal transduction histidine kinase/ActR/RegA family two-component response regulator
MEEYRDDKKSKLYYMDEILHKISSMSQAENEKQLDDITPSILKSVGKYTAADRAYIFEWSSEKKESFKNTFEWCASGIEPQIQNLQKVPVCLMQNWVETFIQKKNIIIYDLEEIAEEIPQEYEILKPQNIHALIAVPIYTNHKFIGFIGLDNPDLNQNMVSMNLLSDVGCHMGSVREKLRMMKELEDALETANLNGEIIDSISKLYWLIYRMNLEAGTYEEISAGNEMHKLTGKHGKTEEAFQHAINTIVDGEHQEMMKKFFDTSTLADRLKDTESIAVEYRAKSGSWHLARFIAKNRDFSGKVTHVLYVTALISAEKRRELNLIILAEDARRANEAKTEFLSRMAHDIRTPMNAVGGFTSIAMANVNDPEKVKKNLEQVEIACGYLQQIVNDALDLAEIGKGKAKVHNEETSISEVFADYEETIRGAMPEKHLNIVCRKHDIIHDCVLTDPLRLRQIYMNLLSNALKFTPGGGTVEFEIYEEELPEKGRVRLVSIIKDNGIGMTPQYMRVMYDRFSRAVDTRLNKVRGSGLGLSIVKELIDLMGGHIEASSALGKGTTFKVTFELDYTDRKHEHKHECRIDGKYDECIGMRILVAEDNDLNYEIAEELLKLHGVICDRAENGQVCVNIFRESAPFYYSAILMDLQMPVMDGLRAARLIRSTDSDYARKIPIIALSANSFSEDVKASLDAGMDEHLSKPFDADKLLELLMLHKNK